MVTHNISTKNLRRSTFVKYLWVGLIIIIFLFGFRPQGLFTSIDSDDDNAYLSQAFTIGLDFDLDYRNEPQSAAKKITAEHPIPKAPMGAGLMAAPFVAAFSLIDRATGGNIINDHKDYIGSWALFGFLFSTVFYFVIALILYFCGAKIIYSKITSGLNFLIAASSGVLYYVLYRFTMSHAFEFFALSLVFWGSISIWYYHFMGSQKNYFELRGTLYMFICALGVVLTIFIRPASLNVILLPYLILFILQLFMSGGKPNLIKVYINMTIMLLFVYLPVGFLYLKLYGIVYASPRAMYGSNMVPPMGNLSDIYNILLTWISLLPNVIKLIFSSEFGLLYTNPVLVFGIVLLIFKLLKTFKRERKKVSIAFLLVLVYTAFNVSIVLFWHGTGSSYGYRYLYSLYPLAYFGYILWLCDLQGEESFGKISRYLVKSINIVFIGFCVFSIFGQIFFDSSKKLTVSPQVNVFGYFREASAKGYNIMLSKEIFSPNAWFMLASQRVPGYVGAKIIKSYSINYDDLADRVGINKALMKEKSSLIDRSANAPGSVSLQVLFLFLFWALMLWLYMFHWFRTIIGLAPL